MLFRVEASKDTFELNPQLKAVPEFERLTERQMTKKQLRSKRYYLKNKTKIREKQKLYYKNNKTKFHNKSKLWFENNKEKHHKSVKKWSIKNKEKIKLYLKEYFSTNLNAKVTRSLRTRLYNLIKKSPNSIEIQSLIGCSYPEFIKHIESKFQEGMSWDNYGKCGWHLDHIKPCSSFDLNKEDNQKECFNYTNLQPLWAKDNLSKNNKLDYVIQSRT